MKSIEELKDNIFLYYIKHFEENSNNIKTIIVNIKTQYPPKVAQLNVNGKITVNPKEIANMKNFRPISLLSIFDKILENANA